MIEKNIEPDLDEQFDMAKPQNQYKLISNSLLLQELAISRYQNRVSDRLINCIWILVRIQKRKKWSEIPGQEDLIQEAFMYTWKNALLNDSSNPYAWFVQVINNSFKRTLEKERLESLTKEFDRLMK